VSGSGESVISAATGKKLPRMIQYKARSRQKNMKLNPPPHASQRQATARYNTLIPITAGSKISIGAYSSTVVSGIKMCPTTTTDANAMIARLRILATRRTRTGVINPDWTDLSGMPHLCPNSPWGSSRAPPYLSKVFLCGYGSIIPEGAGNYTA
jgi:hypothetical protein